jgi:UDP-glucose 4-epimerase
MLPYAVTAMRDPGTCLVTGGAGFIGSHLVDQLCALGISVRVIDDLSTGSTPAFPAGVIFIQESILNPVKLRLALSGVSTVFHLAALTSVPSSWQNPGRVDRVNCFGTLSILRAAEQAGVKRIVYAASSSCYASQDGPITEFSPLGPLSPYAVSKMAGEAYGLAFASAGRLEFVSLRLFNVYGPGQRADSPYAGVIARFADVLKRSETPVIYGDGGQTRDFVHVSDVVNAFWKAAAVERPVTGLMINIGTGVGTSIREVLQLMAALSGRPAVAEHAPARPGEVRHSCAEIARAKQLLGWEPRIRLADGLASLVKGYPPPPRAEPVT